MPADVSLLRSTAVGRSWGHTIRASYPLGDCAVVTLSLPRRKAFDGLPIGERLRRTGSEPECGLSVIDLRTGRTVHTLRLKGVVTELYDVVVLPGLERPMALGFRTDEIERTVVPDEAGTL